ncbi:STAS domain-containing protein [Dactylosporangium sp. CS-033363]|uniref:STAS domain-containing protein n=1 Tax=Dactylosporangium sp. CS-033363 TaxID=3239935 RepID=UPI003D8B19F5
MKQQMVVIHLDDASLVWLSGVVGASLAPALYDVLRELVEQQLKPVMVDCTDVAALDDGVVSVLAAASMQAARRGGIDLRLPRGRCHLVKDATAVRHAISAAYPAAA